MAENSRAAGRAGMPQKRALWDAPPYHPWLLDARDGGLWGIKGAGGWNCYGRDGAVLLPSKEAAEQVIRDAGYEPGEAAR